MPGTSTPLCQALGTTWWLELPTSLSQSEQTIIKTDSINIINQFETDYSRFQATSLVSQLNATGKLLNPTPACVDVLQYGQNLYTQTDGAFNILIGTHLVQRGYDSNYSLTPKTEPVTLPNPASDLHIQTDCITLTRGAVDIGGYGKGYLIDELAKQLEEKHQLSHFLINGGGDIYAKTLPGAPITIYLAQPGQVDAVLGSTTLENEAFAASSPHLRSWTHQGKQYNHLVHTSTSIQSEPMDGVFVKSAKAARADAMATTLLLLNPADITTFCTARQLAAAWYDDAAAKLTATPTFRPLYRL